MKPIGRLEGEHEDETADEHRHDEVGRRQEMDEHAITLVTGR
jgi:hypothetical protein